MAGRRGDVETGHHSPSGAACPALPLLPPAPGGGRASASSGADEAGNLWDTDRVRSRL